MLKDEDRIFKNLYNDLGWEIDFAINRGDWSKTMKLIGEETGTKGKGLFMPIRASITGQLSGPELDQVTRVMGQERVIKRLKEAAKL